MAAAISTWAHLQSFLTASGRSFQRRDARTLLFAVSRGSTRQMHARRVRFPSGSDWLALSLHICPAARLRLRAALVANAELPIGGIAASAEDVFLRQTLPLASLDAAGLEQAIDALVATADALLAALAAATLADSEQPFAYAFR